MAKSEDILDHATSAVLSVADIAYTVGCGLNTSKPWGAVTTYPPDWIQTYVREGYQSNDPLLAHMCKGRGAINWSDVPLDEQTRPMMAHARDFGLLHGTVFANVLMGTKCSVSICHSKSELSDEEIATLRWFTTVYAMHHPRPGQPPKDELHLKYLFLAANGASNDQMQANLGISYRSLGVIKKDAVETMRAQTLPHAITIAVEANLI